MFLKEITMNIRQYAKRLVPDYWFLKREFRLRMGYRLDLKNPRTYNEKLQWLKLYDRNPLYTKLVDKYAVKKWVADKIGEEYVIPSIGVWDKFDDIDFECLPEQFVLKCTHDSGGVVIVKDKCNIDYRLIEKKLTRCLKQNFYWKNREWPYKNVQPRIIAEPYMEDAVYKELRDYKFYVFNGKPRFVMIAKGRHILGQKTFDYFDMDFNRIVLQDVSVPNAKIAPEKPYGFEDMKRIASILSEKIPCVRIDFYEINKKVYFGEMTFFDDGGYMNATPSTWGLEWGELLNLPQR